jgi:aspartate kinase
MIVMKFGGTSTADAAAMRNVIRIVESHRQDKPVVVISAIARATNELEQIARTAGLGDEAQAGELLESLLRRHLAIVGDLIRQPSNKALLEETISLYRAELSDRIMAIAAQKELTAKDMDAICSYGERLSSRIVSTGLHETTGEAHWVDVKDFMVTDGSFGRARPVMDVVKERLERVVRPLVESGKVPVTQGFIGVTRGGEYTTMGRESSDYSATIIGGAMDAEKVQIWTDVDGILTADPRIVSGVKKVRRMSFEEALELSYFGAKVLHPTTILPVLEKHIPVEILNSRREGSGTSVEIESGRAKNTVKAMAHRRNLSVVTITPSGRNGQYAFWGEVLGVLVRNDISVPVMNTSEYHMALGLDEKLVTDRLLAQLGEYGQVTVSPGKAWISLVGKGIRQAPGLMAKVIGSLGESGPVMVSGIASDTSLTVIINADRLAGALKSLHNTFIERSDDPEVFDPVAG